MRWCRAWHLDAIAYAVVLLHIFNAPFTKVEESFNVQATHDLLYFGPFPSPAVIDSSFDHVQFSGVVPRTFAFPVLLSLIATPIVSLVGWCGVASSKLWSLYLIRALIGLAYVASWSAFRRAFAATFAYDTPQPLPAVDNDPSDPHDWSARNETDNSDARYSARGYVPEKVDRSIPLQLALTVVTITQFHALFYASRPLPNVFASIIMNAAFTHYVNRNWFGLIACAGLSTFIVRCDMLLLSFPLIVCPILYGWCSLREMILTGLRVIIKSALVPILIVSILVDSYLWRRTVWPELEVFNFNRPKPGAHETVASGSAAWGVSPAHWYVTSALPRMLLGWMLFAVIGCIKLQHRTTPADAAPTGGVDNRANVRTDASGGDSDVVGLRSRVRAPASVATPTTAPAAAAAAAADVPSPSHPIDTPSVQLLAPAVIFVALYSILPHKEVRFIYPALPLFNAVAAVGLYKFCVLLQTVQRKRRWALPLFVGGWVLLHASATVVFAVVSAANYPGGYALLQLHSIARPPLNAAPNLPLPVVHISNLACTSGVSRFGERNDLFRYSKTEHLKAASEFRAFDYLIAESAPNSEPAAAPFQSDFRLIASRDAVVEAYTGFNVGRATDWPPVSIRTEPKLWLYERKRN